MSREVSKSRAARADLIDIAAGYIRAGYPAAARKFLAAADASFRRLADMPGLGARYEPDEPLYDGLRYLPISGHRAHLVFYRPVEAGIEVFRVLHGARDIEGILAGELGIEADDAPDPG